jgi:release factor glutamine methyltransferase
MTETWTVKKLLSWSETHLKEKGIDAPRSDIEVMLAEILQTGRMGVYLNYDKILTPAELSRYKEFILRRRENEPVQYIIGKAFFYGRTFAVHKGCFIPRFSSEALIDVFLKKKKEEGIGTSILEIGGGSGCIGLTLALERDDITVDIIERSPEASALIRKNMKAHGLAERATLIEGDFFTLSPQKSYDAVICNPPYIVPGDPHLEAQVRDFEPAEALYGGSDGLDFYRRLKDKLSVWAKGSWIFLEIGYNQAKAVQEIFQPAEVEIEKDLSGVQRVAYFYRP